MSSEAGYEPEKGKVFQEEYEPEKGRIFSSSLPRVDVVVNRVTPPSRIESVFIPTEVESVSKRVFTIPNRVESVFTIDRKSSRAEYEPENGGIFLEGYEPKEGGIFPSSPPRVDVVVNHGIPPSRIESVFHFYGGRLS